MREKKESNAGRSNSTKKQQPNLPLINKPQEDRRNNLKSNRINSEKQNEELDN